MTNISFHSLFYSVRVFVQERIFPVQTVQQKKIFHIVSIALGFLVALYIAKRCFRAAPNPPSSYLPDSDSSFENDYAILMRAHLNRKRQLFENTLQILKGESAQTEEDDQDWKETIKIAQDGLVKAKTQINELPSIFFP